MVKDSHFTKEQKQKLSIALLGRPGVNNGKKFPNVIHNHSGKGNPRWKGGVKAENIPLYDTYAHQLEPIEQCRRNEQNFNILEVKCTYCGKWYAPTRTSVHSRINYGFINDTHKFYCSKSCKQQCPLYHKTAASLIKTNTFKAGRIDWIELNREVQPELRKLVFERDNYTCQRCGAIESLHCHHIDPVVNNPIESADIDNCITFCKECHKWAHKLPNCSYSYLSNCLEWGTYV